MHSVLLALVTCQSRCHPCAEHLRLGHVQTLEEEAYEKAMREKNYPEFSSGDVVEVKLVRVALHGGC